MEKIESKSEKYLAIMMDRESLGPIVVASAVGTELPSSSLSLNVL